MKNTPRIFVTGANGFVGSKLIDKLSDASKDVVCLDRIKHSLFDIRSLKTELSSTNIIYHLAGSAQSFGNDPGTQALVKNNVVATYNLLEGISRYCKKPPLLINMSSVHVYKRSTKKIVESSELGPSNLYGVTKLSQELLIKQATKLGIIKSIIFRASNIYGEGHRINHNSTIATFCHRIKRKKELTLIANGEATMDIIYLDDVIDVLTKVEDINSKNGQVYNLASGVSNSVNDIVRNLEKISGLNVKIKKIGGEKKEFEISIDKLKNVLPKWTQCSVYEGLKKTFELSE
jgi:nucleoside-diphosphate-sugar epimerase